jgi:hypothetical protein
MAPDTVCGGTMHTFSTPAVTYASSYIWSLPTGATIIGSSNGSSINVLMGNSSGSIQVRAANACDTSIAIVKNIVVNPAPQPVITQNGWVLSTGTYSSYQWLLNNNIIPGATTNPYTATTQGSYKVIVTDTYGCSDTSSLQVTLGVENISAAESIRMYPNPAITSVTVDAPFVVNAIVYSMDGRMVLQQQNAHTLDISNLSTGIYQVKLTDSDGVVVKLERLVVSPR